MQPFLHLVGAALADPTRIALYALVRRQPQIWTGELAERLGAARGTIHHHVRALRRASMVAVARRGRRTYLSAVSGPWDALLLDPGEPLPRTGEWAESRHRAVRSQIPPAEPVA